MDSKSAPDVMRTARHDMRAAEEAAERRAKAKAGKRSVLRNMLGMGRPEDVFTPAEKIAEMKEHNGQIETTGQVKPRII